MLLLLLGCSDYALNPDVVTPVVTCDPDPPADYQVETIECAAEAAIGAFDPIVEWTWTDNTFDPAYNQIMAAPAIANLTDDNGDGTIDADDVPDVVFTAFSGGAYSSPGALVVVSGSDGHTIWSSTNFDGWTPYSSSGVAVADLGDGEPTILVSATAGLLAVTAEGRFKWGAPVTPTYMGCPSVADVDGDGAAEVIYGPSLVASDGTVRWTANSGTGGYMSFAADLDEDGTAEIVAGNTVYNADGSVRWNDGGPDGWSAVGDLDLDGVPEIIRVGGSVVRATRADGTLMWDFPLDDGGGGPPTVADFDGDGAPEIGVASRSVYRVIEGDGTERWRQTVQDYSSAVTGSSVFDFEGDGAAEVVYADEQTLWVYDGASGAVELTVDSHSSGTLFEYPLIVDVDHDGSAEIVVASNDYAFTGSHGITVIGDAGGTWAPGRPIWNQHAYNIANIDDDGRVPARPQPAWDHWNSFRAGNSTTRVGLGQPDLAIGFVSMCEEECSEKGGLVWVAVENHGEADATEVDVAITTRRGEKDHDVVRLSVASVPAGGVSWAGPTWIEPIDIGSGLKALVDPKNTIVECDEANNSAPMDDVCER